MARLPATARFPLRHALLALAVTAVWGSNFVVIRWALEVMPPLWTATLRFALALTPALLGLAGWAAMRRPAVPWSNLLAYGAVIGAGQFALLFTAMDGHISPGLASLVIQTQVFFTIGLAMLTAGERVRPHQVLALGLAALGLWQIARHTDGQTTAFGLGLVLGAAACWAAGNIIGRRARGVSALAYVVWGNLGAVPLLALFAWVMEGPQALAQGVARAGAGTWAAIAWQAVGNTLFGYTAWGWLLARHPAATVSPWALMVPVFGMGSSALLLAEAMPAWKLGAAALVMAGLALNLGWPWLRQRLGGGRA